MMMRWCKFISRDQCDSLCFWKFVRFTWVVEFVCTKYLVAFAYYPSDFCRVCCDSSCFIPDTSHLFLLYSFSLLTWLIPPSPRTSSLLLWFSVLFFCFKFYWFLLFTVPFLLFVLGVFWFSFFRFLRQKLRLSIWDFLSSPISVFETINFSHDTVWAASHRIWYLVASVSFSSMSCLIETWDFFFDPWII